ncbi:MAG: MarR family winged helix-turn-helix transcriptional regulator [Opitutales bacterium]
MPAPTTAPEAWRRLAGAYWRVSARLEEELAAAGLPGLGWYEVLHALAEAPDQHLRMCELAARAQLSRSGLTRLVDRLEQEKLIERISCPQDRRVLHAQLTAPGARLVRRMQPVHEAGVRRHFAARLKPVELKQLAAVTDKLLAAES